MFLSSYSVILMWIWIKYQYRTLAIMWLYQYEANIVNDLQMICKYQVTLKCSYHISLSYTQNDIVFCLLGDVQVFHCSDALLCSNQSVSRYWFARTLRLSC